MTPVSTMIPALLANLPLLLEDAGGGSSGSGLGNLLIPMILIGGIFYFIVILPERKKQRQREGMLTALKKGDKVMLTSGMYGSIAQIQDDIVTVQVADGVRVRFNRAAIQTKIEAEGSSEKATEKS